MTGDDRAEAAGMESFTLTVLVLFLVGATAVVPILKSTIATVGLTTVEEWRLASSPCPSSSLSCSIPPAHSGTDCLQTAVARKIGRDRRRPRRAN